MPRCDNRNPPPTDRCPWLWINGHGLVFEFSGDDLLRFSGQSVGRVTVTKQETPGEYN